MVVTLLWQIQSHIERSDPCQITECFLPANTNQSYYNTSVGLPTFRSLWSIGVWQWWSLATASQVSQKISSTSASVKPQLSRSFINWRTFTWKTLNFTWAELRLKKLPCDKASVGRPRELLARSEQYCCQCILSGSCVRSDWTECHQKYQWRRHEEVPLLTTMDISRLQTERSLSLLTHILLRASLCPELDLTRNTIAKPPSARTSCRWT